MITAISKSQNTKINNPTNSKSTTQIAFRGNFTNSGKNLVEGEVSRLGGNIRRFAGEITESIVKLFRKLTGNAGLPFSKKPLTANGEIIHFGPDGTPFKIEVPDIEIKDAPVADGQNIYKLTGDGTLPAKSLEVNNEAKSIIKLGHNIENPINKFGEEQVESKIIDFDSKGMPIYDDGTHAIGANELPHESHKVDIHPEPASDEIPAPTVEPEPFNLDDYFDPFQY